MNIIETENLTKFYGRNRGIMDVNIRVKEGEIFGFVGPNGAGKTTTIRLLLGLIFPTRGKAKIFGKDVMIEGKKIREIIGYVPGEVNFYPEAHIEDFLNFSASFYRDVDRKYLARLCQDLSLDVKKKFRELSLGNKKKVAIVQALMHKPKLLILDEPTSSLDPLMQKTLFEILLDEKKKGTTIFFSSHVLSEVERLCDRVAMIKDGKIIKILDIEELKNSYLKVVRLQTEEREKLMSIFKDSKVYSESERKYRILFGGNVNELLQKLSKIEIEDVFIEDPSLEEVFMQYYKEE